MSTILVVVIARATTARGSVHSPPAPVVFLSATAGLATTPAGSDLARDMARAVLLPQVILDSARAVSPWSTANPDTWSARGMPMTSCGRHLPHLPHHRLRPPTYRRRPVTSSRRRLAASSPATSFNAPAPRQHRPLTTLLLACEGAGPGQVDRCVAMPALAHCHPYA